MARYNAWQNKSLLSCVEKLSDTDLTKDRGAFFGSIFATCNHLLWGDQLWMSRFDGGQGPKVEAVNNTKLHRSAQRYSDDRRRTDQRIIRWADKLSEVDLVGPLTWQSAFAERPATKPLKLCVTHFFNHQTHHRGQLHGMLTAAGQKPDDTDLVLMSEDI